ncbi:MAG: hypothetical protein HYS27_28240 [Deltaproteobacteria bacterium]|nr:hypothetical protein [Deltaproteobacteria bacterium]
MPEPVTIGWLLVGGVAVALATASALRNTGLAGFRSAFDHDEDVSAELQESFDRNRRFLLRLTTRQPKHRFASAETTNARKEWLLAGRCVALGKRTTMEISPEGMLGRLREQVGVADVHVGHDSEVDRLLELRGSDPDVIRGLFDDAAARAALVALFREDHATRFVLEEDGMVECALPRRDLQPVTAKALLLRFVALLAALDGAATAEPRGAPPPSTQTLPPQGVGAGSGSPLGVPRSKG